MAKAKEFGNNPFGALKGQLEAAKKAAAEKAAAAKVATLAAAKAAREKAARDAEQVKGGIAIDAELSDERLFLDEMASVTHMRPDPRGRLNAPEPTVIPGKRRVQDDAEVFAELADLVSGAGELDITSTEEYIEGIHPELDRRLLRQLKRGEFAFSAHIDLHGFTSAEARQEVGEFIANARRTNKRCVLIVHGRGLHSKDQIPVLKERLRIWFTHGSLGKHVLAFCTARVEDGGAGAMYVLLKK